MLRVLGVLEAFAGERACESITEEENVITNLEDSITTSQSDESAIDETNNILEEAAQ